MIAALRGVQLGIGSLEQPPMRARRRQGARLRRKRRWTIELLWHCGSAVRLSQIWRN